MDKLQLRVTGMTCGGCENAVKRTLQKLDGVTEVTASHAQEAVGVTFRSWKGHAGRDQAENRGGSAITCRRDGRARLRAWPVGGRTVERVARHGGHAS